MLKLFGRNYEEIGSSDAGLILKGNVKIQWGNKFIDLLDSDGNINCKIKSFIKKVSSESDIKQDGFYYYNDTLVAKVGDNIVLLASESGTTYVSFMLELDTTESLKYTALKNIGFVYDTKLDSNKYPTKGIIYITDTQTLYIVNNGQLTKYTAPIPNPLTEQLIIHKSNDSEGALIILGEGVENGLLFNSLKTYSKDGYLLFEFDKGLLFRSGEKKGLEVTPQGIKTDGILSFQATTDAGYRIYYNEGKYILEIDKLYVREPDWEVEDSLKYIVPYRCYRKENIVLRVEVEYREDNPEVILNYVFVLKYALSGDMYFQGEKCRIYVDNPDHLEIGILQFTVTDVDYDAEGGNTVLKCFNVPDLGPDFEIMPVGWTKEDALSITNSYCCIVFAIDDIGENELSVQGGATKSYPENNSYLMIGRLDFSANNLGNSLDYNDYKYGIVSKKTVMYSAKFMKDPNANDYKAFPFYSDTLYHYINDVSKYGGGTDNTDWDNVLVPLGVVKKMIPTYSVTGLQTMLASLNGDNPSPQEGTYLHFVNGHYVWDNVSLALGQLLTDLNNASYTPYPQLDGFLYFNHSNGTFQWVDITNSQVGLLGLLLTDLNDITKTLQTPGTDKYLHYDGRRYEWVSLPSMLDYLNLMDTIIISNIDDEITVSPSTFTIKAAETYAGLVNISCGTKWTVYTLSAGTSIYPSSGTGNGTASISLTYQNTTLGNKTYTIIIRDMYYGRVSYLDHSKIGKHETRITITLLGKVPVSWENSDTTISASTTSRTILIYTSYDISSANVSQCSFADGAASFDNTNVSDHELASLTLNFLQNTTGNSRTGYIVINTVDGSSTTMAVTQLG